MKRSNKKLNNVCCAVATAALAVSMVPVGAVSAFADEGTQSSAGQDSSVASGTEADGSAGNTEEGSGTATGGTAEGSGSGSATDPTPTPTPTPEPSVDTDKLASKVVPHLELSYAYSHGSNSSQDWSTVRVDGAKEIAPGKKAVVTTSSATKRLECIRMSLSLAGQELDPAIKDSYTLGIKYRALVGKKWSKWAKNGASVGVDGTKLTAIQVKLTGTAAKYYSVHYRVKTRGTSWLGWATDGAKAGTSGILRDVSDLEVELKKTGKKAPGSTATPFVTSSSAAASYSLVKSAGSALTAGKLGKTAGKASKSASNAVAIAVKNTSTTVSGNFTYKVYQKTKGMSKAAAAGKKAGVKNKKYPVTAISINRNGGLKAYYDVYYRVYVKNYGWMGWAKNGQLAGSKAFDGFNVTAYQVRLVYKGGKAPGSTSNYYSDSNGVFKKASEKLAVTKAKARLDAKAAKTSSATSYLLLCDRSTCYTAVYTGSKGNWKRVKFWQCCVGASSTPTPKGSYTVEAREPVFHGEENAYSCYYGVVFNSKRELMFHSVGYKNNGSQKDKDIIFSNLGQWASHGCVRLKLENAKWLYDHVGSATGTKVVIF